MYVEVFFLSTVLFYRDQSTYLEGQRRKSTLSKGVSTKPVQKRKSSRLSQRRKVTMAKSSDDDGYDKEKSHSGESKLEEEPKITFEFSMILMWRSLIPAGKVTCYF